MTGGARGSQAVERIRALLHDGAPWAATDVFREALADHPDDAELSYWGALAYARSGARREARTLLDRLRATPDVPVPLLQEALCLSGRLWKDEADNGAARPLPREGIVRAREQYLAAHALTGDSYPGANAATLSLLLGERDVARALATRLVERLTPAARTAWQHAALGEAFLVLGDIRAASGHYGEASAGMARDAGGIASMRRQVRLLCRVHPDAAAILDVLTPAAVLAFAGHLVDRPGQPTPRFPAALEPIVAETLLARLRAAHLPVVYTSAACGADLLFIEAAVACGAEINIVLPFDRQDFVETSVAVGGAGWVERFERALAAAHRIVLATEERHLGDDVLFAHAFYLVEGLSLLRASQLETDPSLICVLDPDATSAIGGTRAAYDRWKQVRGEPEVIDLRDLRTRQALPAHGATPEASPGATMRTAARPLRDRHPERTIKSLLFADMTGFGRVHDALAPLFHARFLGLIADEIAACATPPLEANTWGDALYVVFDDPRHNADFALRLLDHMKRVDWAADGLSESSGIRVALHAGPVFCGFDPVVGREHYFGANVTKAARIEPVTPPGLIYASEAFVASLASLDIASYAFEYVGNLELAKRHGESRIYRLERR